MVVKLGLIFLHFFSYFLYASMRGTPFLTAFWGYSQLGFSPEFGVLSARRSVIDQLLTDHPANALLGGFFNSNPIMTHYQTATPHHGAVEICVTWLSSLHRKGWQNAFMNLYQELLSEEDREKI